jgi:putative ABC transport system permease protein
VLGEGTVIALFGIVAGVVGGFALARIVGTFIPDIRMPDVIPAVIAGAVLIACAVIASLMPAARASRIDVMQALRAE